MNGQIQLIIILVIILILISLFENKENFVYVKNVYGVGGTCNDYIPDYNPCPTSVPAFDTDNIENFACPCSARRNRIGNILSSTDTINITNQWNG